ncbi:MAG: hypothetical protein U5K76_03130 [Woeseiaceae bacterium]|nr:hypothetical protein [Woeseiaceae bacterium]
MLGNDGHATALILDGERYMRTAGSRESVVHTKRVANALAVVGGDGTGTA